MTEKHPGYLVWNPLRGMPTRGHTTYEQASNEAERLAFVNPGHEFFIMVPVAMVSAERPQPVVEVRALKNPLATATDADIPF